MATLNLEFSLPDLDFKREHGNNGTKNLAKSPKCHLRKCHDIFCQADEQTQSLLTIKSLSLGKGRSKLEVLTFSQSENVIVYFT